MSKSEDTVITPLDFSLASQGEIKNWLARILNVDFESAITCLCETLDEMVWVDLTVEDRWSLVELFRPVSYTLLLRNINVIDIMTEEQYETFERSQQIIMSLQLINRAIIKAGRDGLCQDIELVSRALHRAMADSSNLLLLSYTRHQPVPESLWREMHLLYKLAKFFKAENFELEDKLVSRDKCLSIESMYKRSLLLSRSRHNQLSFHDIRLINRAVAHWVHHAHLISLENSSSCFIVDLDSDVGLSYAASFTDEDERHLLVLDVSSVYEKIKKLASVDKNKRSISLPDRILRHIVEAWNLSTGRKHRRIETSGEVELCVGFETVFYHLNGGQTLESYLAELSGPTGEIKQFSRDHNDVWSMAHDAGKSDDRFSTDAPIEFNMPVKMKKISSNHYPITVCSIVNTCAGGYCLSTPVLKQYQLRSGELVAVREKGRKDWLLATVRWTQSKGIKNLEMGLELLASGSKPCIIAPRKKGEEEREYQHAFLIPEVPAVNSEPTLITPRETFRGGLRFVLLYDDKVRKGQLLECVSSSPGFSQFQYQAQSGLLS